MSRLARSAVPRNTAEVAFRQADFSPEALSYQGTSVLPEGELAKSSGQHVSFKDCDTSPLDRLYPAHDKIDSRAPKQRQYNRTEYSKAHPELYDLHGRKSKANKILAVLSDYFSKFSKEELKQKRVLDLGCSTGVNSYWLSKYFMITYGIDIDREAIAFAKHNFGSSRLHFGIGDGLNVEFPDSYFDVIVCSHVYAHVPDNKKLISEIHRLLKVGGVCFFAAGNRVRIIEPVYKLPFLSLLPKRLAHTYLHLAGHNNYCTTNYLSLWGLRRLTSAFRIIDYTQRILVEPEKFHLDEATLAKGSLLNRIMSIFIPMIYCISPTYIWLLEKTVQTRPADQ